MPTSDSEPLYDPRPGLDELDVRRTADEVRRRLFGIESTPVRLGRFRIDGLAGSGAMGLVHTAYDPLLERRIAIKVIRPTHAGSRSDALLEEARSLAKLTHPNVVPVYEVGTVDTEIFVAMELVEGTDLRGWLGETSRSRRQVLDVLDQALAGLEAAHAAGLVHRDFKPDNLLLGADGRVRVADFGLASALDPPPNDARLDGPMPAGPPAGTPAYMAPEVAAGAPATAASDQYSVGITLFEALHGHRPAQPAPRDAPAVPRWLARVIERATAEDPESRYPALAELRDALRADPARRWRRWGAGGLLLVTAAGAYGLGQRPPPPRCTGASAELADAWGDERREAVEHALQAVDLPYAPSTAARVSSTLDAYADAWVRHHTESCEATTVRGEQSATVMDLRMACLRRARITMRAVSEQFLRGDQETLDAADRLLDGLAPLERCADVEALSRETPLGPESLIVRLAEANTTRIAGRYDEAVLALRTMEAELVDGAHGGMLAEVQLELGLGLDDAGHYDQSAAALERALQSSLMGNHQSTARRAASNLAQVYGLRLTRADEGMVYAKIARDMLGPTPPPEAEAGVRDTLGNVLITLGRLDEAEAEFRASVELETEALGPDDLDVATSRTNLGSVLEKQAHYAEAEVEFRAALTIRERALGPDHPRVSAARVNLGNVLRHVGRREDAEAMLRTALDAWTRTLEPSHPNIGSTLLNLGAVLYDQRKLDEAESVFQQALENLSRALGSDHPAVIGCRINLSNVLVERSEYARAEVEDRAALESLSRTLGADHPHMAIVRGNLGSTLRHLGRLEEAEVELRAALELWERISGARDPDVGRSRWELGKVLRGRGRGDEAERELELALEILGRTLPSDDREMVDLRKELEEVRGG